MLGDSMELIYYTLFSVCAFGLALIGLRKDSRLVEVLWFLLLTGFSIVVRETPNIDILNYFIEMHSSLKEVVSNSKQLQEFSFWGGSSILYSLLGNERWVFYLWDALAFYLVLSVRRRLGLGWYFVPFFFIAFPSVLGFQNGYRQFLATLMIINATSFCLARQRNRYWKVWYCVFFLLGVTIHRSVWLLLPVLVFVYASVKKQRYIQVLFLIAFTLLAPFILILKEEKVQTGLSLEFVYFFFISALLSVLFLSRLKVREGKLDAVSTKFIFFYVELIAIVGLIRMNEDLHYERVILLFIPQILVLILWSLQNRLFRFRRFVVLSLLLLFMVPSYTFSSSYAMICNESWIDENVTAEYKKR